MLYIVDRFPRPDASGVYINDIVWVQFSEPIASGTVTYYNFTVNERDTYDPVPGNVSTHGVSGGLNDALALFVPTNGLKRNTNYSVLVSTGIGNKTGNEYLDHDDTWYFRTGSGALAYGIGDSIYHLAPSGFTSSGVPVGSGPVTSGVPLEILETSPAIYDTNLRRDLPRISIRFNDVVPSGISLYDKITITQKGVL